MERLEQTSDHRHGAQPQRRQRTAHLRVDEFQGQTPHPDRPCAQLHAPVTVERPAERALRPVLAPYRTSVRAGCRERIQHLPLVLAVSEDSRARTQARERLSRFQVLRTKPEPRPGTTNHPLRTACVCDTIRSHVPQAGARPRSQAQVRQDQHSGCQTRTSAADVPVHADGRAQTHQRRVRQDV